MTMDLRELRFEVEEFCYDYGECLDEFDIERWPDFFTEDCLYKIVSRENFERNLPLATMMCEGKGGLKDRVVALTETAVYHDRALRHLISNVRVKGVKDGVIDVRANYVVLETPTNEYTKVFNTGKYIDKLVREDGALRFKEKLCVFDSVMVPTSLIYPL